MVDARGIGGMGEVAVVATVGASVAVTEAAVLVVMVAGVGARVLVKDDDGVDGRLVELPRRGSSRTGVTWKREKRPAADGPAALDAGCARDMPCGRVTAGSSKVQGADTGDAAVAAVLPALPASVTSGTGMLLPVSVEIWPADWVHTGTDVADKIAAAEVACGITAPTEWETVAECSANTESGGTCGCECAGVSTGATVFCENMACSPCSMLLFMVLPCSFCSSNFKSSRLVATAGLRSGGTEEGRELDGATVTTAGGAVDTATTDAATVCTGRCLGEPGAAGSTGAMLAAGLSAGTRAGSVAGWLLGVVSSTSLCCR